MSRRTRLTRVPLPVGEKIGWPPCIHLGRDGDDAARQDTCATWKRNGLHLHERRRAFGLAETPAENRSTSRFLPSALISIPVNTHSRRPRAVPLLHPTVAPCWGAVVWPSATTPSRSRTHAGKDSTTEHTRLSRAAWKFELAVLHLMQVSGLPGQPTRRRTAVSKNYQTSRGPAGTGRVTAKKTKASKAAPVPPATEVDPACRGGRCRRRYRSRWSI